MKEFIEYNYDLRCDDLAILNNLLYFKHLDKFYIILIVMKLSLKKF